jgi:hypothetical protein
VICTWIPHGISQLEQLHGDPSRNDLVEGGNSTGSVAFDAGAGTYFVIYKPDPFNAARGIWQIEVQ